MGRVLVYDADTEARRRRLRQRQDEATFRAARRGAGGPPGRADQAEDVPVSWTVSKALWAVTIGLVFSVVIAGMAVAAIAFQTGFLNAVLPAAFTEIRVFFLPWVIDLAKLAPVGLEFTSWALALTTLVLVLRRLPYGRWHRAMWFVSIFVAATNGLHIATATHNVSLGLGYGAFSIIGPAMIHYYVLFLVLLREGVPARRALTEAGSSMARTVWRAVARAVGAVVRLLLAVVFHPYITLRSVSIMAGTQLPYRQAQLIANRRYRLKLAAEIRGQRWSETPAPIGWLAWMTARVRRSVTAAETMPAAVQPAPVPVRPVQHAVPEPERAVPPRPDTTLAGVGPDESHGGVLVAARDPEHDRPGVQDDDDSTRALLAVLDDPHALDATVTAWARTHGTRPEPGAQHGTDTNVQHGDRGVVHAGGDVHDDRADDAVEARAGSSPAVPGQRAEDSTVPRAAGSSSTRADEHGAVIARYWQGVHDGEDAQHANRKEIAGELFGVQHAERKRSMVSRVWNACIAGEHADPDPGYPHRPRAARGPHARTHADKDAA